MGAVLTLVTTMVTAQADIPKVAQEEVVEGRDDFVQKEAVADTGSIRGKAVRAVEKAVATEEVGEDIEETTIAVSPEQMEISKEIPLPRSMVLQKEKNRAISYDSRENLVLPVFSGD